jgi:hypothetical protein
MAFNAFAMIYLYVFVQGILVAAPPCQAHCSQTPAVQDLAQMSVIDIACKHIA